MRSAYAVILFSVIAATGCAGPDVEELEGGEGYRVRSLMPQEGRGDGFSSVPSGPAFINSLSDSAFLANRHRINGSGIAIGDVDGDGWPDILLTGLESASALYRNTGDWQFEDITAPAGLTGINQFATGAALSDVNGDGHLDLLVTSLGRGIQLLLNDGQGRFTDVSAESGLMAQGGATTMALADIDGDRDLDLYVGFYKTATAKDLFAPDEIAFDRVVRQAADSFFVDPSMAMHYRVIRQGSRLMLVELAEPDVLYINDGTGTFAAADWTQGTFLDEAGNALKRAPLDWALTVRFQDLNGDGWSDLYVCNDFESPDHIWLGNGSGQFRAASSHDVRQTSQSTMSVAIADINADGHVDLFLADMLSRNYARRQRQHQVIPPEVTGLGDTTTRIQVMQNMLLIGRGDGSFAEVARFANLAATEWTWSSAFLDADLDGYQDLILTTGHAYDAMDADAQMQAQRSGRHWREQLPDFPDLDLPNMAFRNLGDGTFAMQPGGWGLGLEADVAHGLATGDFDQDGDLDVVISRLNDRVGVFRNNADAPRVAVRLAGLPPNIQGIGANLRLIAPDAPLQQQEIVAGGNYLSSSEPVASFAWFAGARLEVRWSGGQVSRIENLQPGFLYEVQEAKAGAARSPEAPLEPMFAAQPVELVHREQRYADFERQPLLPRRLSQRGPALVAADLDGNGDDDLLLGGGRDGLLQYALNFGGHFGRAQTLGDPAAGDHAGVLVHPSSPGSEPEVVVAISNYERTPEQAGDAAGIEVLGLRTRQVRQRIDIGLDTPGPMVLADFTGDGELEFFVGGHFRPGRFPEAATSRLYRRESGVWQPDEELSAPFAELGLISGATATDINQDGRADLALADVLGPVRVFVNRGSGVLVEMTRMWGLGDQTGWWNGVATGDFDADGRLDLIATNSGLNLHYKAPVRWYYGDIDGSGTVEIIEAQPVPGGYGFVRDLPTMLNAIPLLAQRVNSYSQFASMTIDEVMGDALGNLTSREVKTGAVMVFFNRGDEFEAVPLAGAAQLSMAYGAVVADFDGDGSEDVFLSQNEFALPPSVPRLDSGLGIVLLGDGSGHLIPAGPVRSGIRVYGAQRAAVAADFDGDHRTDLAIAQNAGPVRWYRNLTGGIGMRVRLAGPAGNPKAIGASIRLEYADSTLGPVRLVAAGGGYWSQNSATQLLGISRPVAHVRVRWPDGRESRVPVEEDTRRIRITYAR